MLRLQYLGVRIAASSAKSLSLRGDALLIPPRLQRLPGAYRFASIEDRTIRQTDLHGCIPDGGGDAVEAKSWSVLKRNGFGCHLSANSR